MLAETLPPSDDPAVAAILRGLVEATRARGCVLALQIMPDGPKATYRIGHESAGPRLVIRLEPGDAVRGLVRLFGAGAGPAASPSALECMRPVLEGAVLALIDRNTASRQIDILMQILGAQDEANLLMDATGEILFANAHGEELLSLHTEQPQAELVNEGRPAPLLSLIVAEIGRLRASADTLRHQAVTTGDGSRWRLDVTAVDGLGAGAYFLVVLTPMRLLDAHEIRRRFEGVQISRREAEVLASVLKGHKACEIAGQLGITEYTVKDHLKHAYAKLGIKSRGQLVSRLATAMPGAS